MNKYHETDKRTTRLMKLELSDEVRDLIYSINKKSLSDLDLQVLCDIKNDLENIIKKYKLEK